MQLLVPQIMSLQFMFHHAHAQRANFIMAHHSMKLGKTTRTHDRLMWRYKCVDIVSKCLPGETEKDVNDDSCQLYTLFPVLPQHSCQGSQGRLCTHRHTTLLLGCYTHTGTETDKDKGLTQHDGQKRDFKPYVVLLLISKIVFTTLAAGISLFTLIQWLH